LVVVLAVGWGAFWFPPLVRQRQVAGWREREANSGRVYN
jgi:hypothetical protein